MTLVDPASLVRLLVRQVWAVRRRVPLDAWADEHRRLPRGSPEPGRWRTARTEYMREPMLAVEDPAVAEVTLMMGSQLGKTEFDLNTLFKSVYETSNQWLFVLPNDLLARSIIKNRVKKALVEMPLFRGVYRDKRTESAAAELHFASGAAITATGSGSAANVRSRPIGFIIVDELELCVGENPEILQECRQRTGAFASRTLIIKTGTAGIKGQGLDAELEASDYRQYWVPCPHCGRYQVLVFRQVKWDGGLAARGDDVERDAFYECEHCHAAIYNHHKPAMLARGRWLKRGELMARREDGTSEIVGAVHGSSRVGFQLSSLYSPFKPFGWVARDFVEAKGFPGQAWVNGKLAEAWHIKGESLEIEELRRLCVPVGAGGYALGTVPPDVLLLTMSVDVQADHCWAIVEGWTAGGINAYLIWAERIESPAGTGLWQLDRLRARVFPRQDFRSSLGISLGFVDSGFRTGEVYAFCLERKARFWFPVDGQEHLASPHYAKSIEKMPGAEGKPLKGGVQLLHVNNSHWSAAIWGQLQNSFRAVTGKTDDLPPDLARPPGRRFFPEDCPEWVLVQLTSEAAITRKKGGRVIVVYDKRPGRSDNHVLDCFRYNAAGADWGGVRNLTAAAPAAQAKRIEGATGETIERARGRWRR